MVYAAVFLGKNVKLSYHLTGVLNELCSVIGECDAASASVEYLYADLLFKLLHR